MNYIFSFSLKFQRFLSLVQLITDHVLSLGQLAHVQLGFAFVFALCSYCPTFAKAYRRNVL